MSHFLKKSSGTAYQKESFQPWTYSVIFSQPRKGFRFLSFQSSLALDLMFKNVKRHITLECVISF